jgi:hypothetical protein
MIRIECPAQSKAKLTMCTNTLNLTEREKTATKTSNMFKIVISHLVNTMHFWNNVHQVRLMPNHWKAKSFQSTADSRYLEFDETMEKIRVNRSLTQEELDL